MQTIKITKTDKGEYHWEDFLLKKQRIRTENLLTRLGINPWSKRRIMELFKKRVKRDNIVALYQHDIRIFINALVTNDLEPLTKSTTQIS